MRINHDETKAQIIVISNILREQAKVASEYRKARESYEQDDTYSVKFKQPKLAALREEYIAKYREAKAKVVEHLQVILDNEIEQEAILELDVPEFENTLAAIDATQGKLPVEVIETIRYNFAGQYQALLAIKAVFERYDVDLSKYGYDAYVRSAAIDVEELTNEAESIEQSEISSCVTLRQLFKNVIAFGEARGVKFSDEEKDFGELDEETREILARQAMGLPIDVV